MRRSDDPLRTTWLEALTAPVWLTAMLVWAVGVYCLGLLVEAVHERHR